MAPHGIVGVSRQLCPSEVSEGHGFFCRNGSAFDEGGQRVICANSASKPLPICKLLPAVFSLSLRNSPRCPPLCSHLVLALSHVLSVYRTIALSSASPFVCFHEIPRRPPLISRLAAAPIVFFSPLRQNHCRAEGTARSGVKWSAHLAGNVVPPPSLRAFLPHS